MKNGEASAFPIPQPTVSGGLTKRELLAFMLMQGIRSNPNCYKWSAEAIANRVLKDTNTLLQKLEDA